MGARASGPRTRMDGKSQVAIRFFRNHCSDPTPGGSIASRGPSVKYDVKSCRDLPPPRRNGLIQLIVVGNSIRLIRVTCNGISLTICIPVGVHNDHCVCLSVCLSVRLLKVSEMLITNEKHGTV